MTDASYLCTTPRIWVRDKVQYLLLLLSTSLSTGVARRKGVPGSQPSTPCSVPPPRFGHSVPCPSTAVKVLIKPGWGAQCVSRNQGQKWLYSPYGKGKKKVNNARECLLLVSLYFNQIGHGFFQFGYKNLAETCQADPVLPFCIWYSGQGWRSSVLRVSLFQQKLTYKEKANRNKRF